MKTDRWRQTERDGSRDTDIHEHCKHPSYLLLLLAALSWRVLPSSRSSDRVRGEMAQPPGLILMKNVFFSGVCFTNLQLQKSASSKCCVCVLERCECDRLLVCREACVQPLCGCISLLGLLSGKINLYLQNENFSNTENSISMCPLKGQSNNIQYKLNFTENHQKQHLAQHLMLNPQ